ncbi:MAG: Fe-S protein assembly co-chaperone HscB [Vicinamibacterales bacterium]
MNDYFSLLGVPRILRLDSRDLERRYRALSREVHPDFFHNAPLAEKRASLERTSNLNDAYRTLREPVSRITHLIELESAGAMRTRADDQVPPALLEEVFALNEELDEVRALRATGVPDDEWIEKLEKARRPIEARRVAHEADLEELSARWDAAAMRAEAHLERQQVLATLRDRLLERNYIANLIADIERTLGEGHASSHA